MPRYEYHCDACGKTFEATQKMSDPPLTACTCGQEGQVKRLLSAGNGLIFKGSGFYITDYKNGTASKAGETAKESKESTPATSGGTCGAGACPACTD